MPPDTLDATNGAPRAERANAPGSKSPEPAAAGTAPPRNKLEHALAHAARGWPVFPLQSNGKLPTTDNGHLSATTDPDTIRAWWTCPLSGSVLDRNIGVRPVAGQFAVVDLDTKQGVDGPGNYVAAGGVVDGLVCATPSGGRHVYLSGQDIGTSAGRIAPGCDTRGSDGYVVAPGSTIDGKAYELVSDGPMLPIPAFVRERVPARAERPAVTTTYAIEDDQPRNVERFTEVCRRALPASAGVWHDASRDLACEAVRCAVSVEKATGIMLAVWVPLGSGFEDDGRADRWPADVAGSYEWALSQGEHGVHSVDAQLLAFAGLTIVPPPPEPAPARTVDAAAAPFAPAGPNWTLTRPTTLHGLPVPRREFIVDQWLSPGHVTILYGDGGLGKSLLTQQLMTACATGTTWCGLPVARCRALALACEDDDAELHRRQVSINAAMGLTLADLDDMAWISGVGEDNTLVTFDRDDRMSLTPAFARLEREVRGFRPRLIVCDTAADTFGGDEVRRRQVRQFVGAALGKLAKEYEAAVLLNAHPSRSGMGRGGDLDGGSTAWSNTARARWSLTRPEGRPGEVDPDERILARRKSNYASVGDTVRLRWQAGALVPVTALTGEAWLDAQKAHEVVFLRLLNRLNLSGRNVSPSKFSDTYAPKVFSLHPERDGRLRADFEGAMDRLFSMGLIQVVDGGRPSRPSKHIVPTVAERV